MDERWQGVYDEPVRQIELKCCASPSPILGSPEPDGSVDLYCRTCDASFAQLFPTKKED